MATPVTFYLSALARASVKAGDRQHACDILDRLSQMAVDSYVSPFDFAIVHAALDDISAALDHLEAACQQRIMRLIELPMPAFDELRPCHRVQAILTAMKLHPPALD